MNSYLFEKIGQSHRTDLLADAAAARLTAGDGARPAAPRRTAGLLASIRRIAATSPDLGVLPRLSGYPTARP